MAPSAISIVEEPTFDLSSKVNTLKLNANGAHHAPDGYAVSKQMISQALKKRVESIDQDSCEAGEEDTFFVADLGDVYRQHLRWKMNLSRIKPHYGESQSSCEAMSLADISLLQLSSATPTLKSFVSSPSSVLASTVPPKLRLSKSSSSVSTHLASSMLSHARPSPTSVMLLSKGSSR